MKRLVATVLLLSTFGFAVVAIWPGDVSGDTGPTKIQVVNTPLPVSIQGTANVSAAQSGQWKVGLASDATVKVGNGTSNPVPVRDVDVREPVMVTATAVIREGFAGCFAAHV